MIPSLLACSEGTALGFVVSRVLGSVIMLLTTESQMNPLTERPAHPKIWQALGRSLMGRALEKEGITCRD